MKKASTTTVRRIRQLQGRQSAMGLDPGDRSSFYCVLNGSGEVILEKRVTTSPEAMTKTFGKMPRSRIALETGTHSPWVRRLLSELGHEAIVAHARNVRLIGESRRKDIEGLSRSDLTPCADPNTKFCPYDGPPSQLVQIKPGAQHKMQRLMNLFYDLRQAGLYHAHRSFHLEFADRPALEGKYGFQQRNFEQRVALDVENGRAGDLLAAFSPIIMDLGSADTIRRQYARMVLLTLAPRFAEDRILAMADQQGS